MVPKILFIIELQVCRETTAGSNYAVIILYLTRLEPMLFELKCVGFSWEIFPDQKRERICLCVYECVCASCSATIRWK